ncbi:MAG: type II toxin-antitoxin system VapC family toxin [Desulfobacteraceae bacterium]|jgi:predicted nucleic acid-binding protein
MIIVLDASGAVEIALGRENSILFMNHLKNADVILAPDTYVSEITNIFWKYSKFSQFSDEICLKGIDFCINLIDDFIDSKDLWREAYFESVKNDSSTYDMFYLVAARRNYGLIISMDKKLNKLAEKEHLKMGSEDA